jgi:hypothetical protein
VCLAPGRGYCTGTVGSSREEGAQPSAAAVAGSRLSRPVGRCVLPVGARQTDSPSREKQDSIAEGKSSKIVTGGNFTNVDRIRTQAARSLSACCPS